jgi:Carboxypeptidase regulatory-like domain
MLKQQIDQYDMILSTEKHLLDHEGLWVSSTPIVATKEVLNAKINELSKQVAIQLINSTGITAEKDDKRHWLESLSMIVSAACCGYASANNNTDLYNKCKYAKTDLVRFRDAELVGICTNLYNDTLANASALVPHGITKEVLVGYQDAITAFSTVMKNPTEAIGQRATATAQIAVLLPEIMTVLTTRLDNDVVALSLSQPDFVSTYTNVRAISSTGNTTLSLTTTMLDATTGLPVPNVTVTIVGENITRKSSVRGYNTILNLTQGDHELTVSHPNYTTQSHKFSVVNGETTEVVMKL